MTAKELRQIRKRLGLTQKELAEGVGISPNSLAMQERGEIGISEPVARLVRLIGAGVDVEAALESRSGLRASASEPPKRSSAEHSSRESRKRKRQGSLSGRGR